MSCIDSYLRERIAKMKTELEAYDAAILAIVTKGQAQYQLDTGQTRMLVTRLNLATVQKARDSLLSQLSLLDARVNRKGHVRGVPGW